MFTPTLAFIARGGFFGPGFLLPMLTLLLLGGAAFWLIRCRIGGPAGRGSAISLLEDRFARGEIDQTEFEHRRAVLVGADVTPPATAGPGTAK